MRIIEKWQYKYIEKCLYTYYDIKCSDKRTEQIMVKAIDATLVFFDDTTHEAMIRHYYFDVGKSKVNKTKHYQQVCDSKLFIEDRTGYLIRKEIVYKIAMNCYGMGLFSG